jgi:hypothetical protein
MRFGHFIIEPLDLGYKLGILNTRTRRVRLVRLPVTIVWAHLIWPIKMWRRGHCTGYRAFIGMLQTVFMGGARNLFGDWSDK